MAIPELKFTKDWNNAEDFPAVANDAAQARANIQFLHDETKQFINDELVPAVQAAGNILKHCWRVRDFDPVTGETGEWRYIYSENRNTYPDSGIKNEREYEYLGVPVDFATPPGGKAGQVLAKATDADHDYHWADLAQEVIVIPGEGDGSGEGSGSVSVNISGAVRYNISQALTPTQKALARQNIGAASQSLSIQVDGIAGDMEGIKSEVADVTGRVTTLTQTVEEIKAGAGDGNGNNAELTVRVEEIEAKVEDNEKNIGTLSVQAEQILQRVEDAEGNVASFETRVDGISAKVESADGRMTEIEASVEEVRSLIQEKGDDGEVDFSEINQKIDAIEARVEDVETGTEGNTTEIGELKLKSDEFSTKISKVEGDVAENAEGIEENAAKYSEIKQTIDDISFTVSDPINGGTNRYVTMTLTIGNNTHTGVVMIDGNVDVSGQLSAEALYATLGDIARLKVDSLSTSRRIPKYLSIDTSDDNYIEIEEQNIVLRRAWTDGSSEQARDDFGALLYWEASINDAIYGDDGYPYVNGQRVFITTEQTPYPVYVYKYQEGDRLKIFFDEDNNYGPRMVWGEGYGYSNKEQGKAYIQKLGNSLDIYYHGSDNVKKGIFIGDQYTDIVGQRRITSAKLSGNTVTVTLEGGKSESFTFNESGGKIVSVTTSSGHTVTLEGF